MTSSQIQPGARIPVPTGTPLHLSGAACGDEVVDAAGQPFGILFRWTGDGAAVLLAGGCRVKTANGLVTDTVCLTDAAFWTGSFAVVKAAR